MKKFLKIGLLRYGANRVRKSNFTAELKKLISLKQRLPLQYMQ